MPGCGAIMRAADLALFYQGLLHNPGGLWDAAVLDDAKTNVRCDLPRQPAAGSGEPHARARARGRRRAALHALRQLRRRELAASIGHAGAHRHVGWADPETGISFAYCTNGLDADVMKEGVRGVNLSGIAAALAD